MKMLKENNKIQCIISRTAMIYSSGSLRRNLKFLFGNINSLINLHIFLANNLKNNFCLSDKKLME